ncbi:MAG TPA: hypothetical protein VIT42_02445 [Microlunatus sp.]
MPTKDSPNEPNWSPTDGPDPNHGGMAAGEDGKPIEQARWVDQEGNYNHLAQPIPRRLPVRAR